MRFPQKITKLKRVSIVPFLLASIPFVFIYLFLRDIPFLSSLFIQYVDSGSSIFFPFLSSTIIAFQFTTGHLIDIIIVVNIVTFLERGGYHYVNVCLRSNYLDMYSTTSFLDTDRTQDESPLKSELPLGLKGDTDSIANEESIEDSSEINSRIKSTYLRRNSGYSRNLIKIMHNQLNSLHNFRKKNFLNNNFYTSFQHSSTKNIVNYYLPSKSTCIFSNSIVNIIEVGGR